MDTTKVLGHKYVRRIVDARLEELLEAAGAVIIEGPRGCGKTMTGLHHASSYVFLDDPDVQEFAQVAPKRILEGARPRLLDEWQLEPHLWNLTRRAVDAAKDKGQFILTGSAVPADDVTRHSGAARFLRLRQRTMTWQEKNASTGAISLEQLFAGAEVKASLTASSLDTVIDTILQPGFPGMRVETQKKGVTLLDGYLEEISHSDVPRLGDIRQHPSVIRQLIRALARRTGSKLTYAGLKADLVSVAPDIHPETIGNLVELLERLFVVELIPFFPAKQRSRARLRRSPIIHLADPALAAVALGADKQSLNADLNTLGFLFESAVVHDLLVFTEALGGHVYHYRDSNGHEMDAVLSFPNGQWAGIEVKLGGRQASTGADSLLKAAEQIDAKRPPSFLAVITGTGFLATLPNGVVTFPLSVLGV